MESALAVSFYQLSVFVHVSAVVIAFGPMFAYPVIFATAERSAPRSLPFAMRASDRIDKTIVYPAALLVGITGIYQALDGPFEFGDDMWLDIGLLLWLLMLLLPAYFFRRAVNEQAVASAERMIEAAGPDGEVAVSDEYRQSVKVYNVLGPILGLMVLVTIYLMEIKPFSG